MALSPAWTTSSCSVTPLAAFTPATFSTVATSGWTSELVLSCPLSWLAVALKSAVVSCCPDFTIIMSVPSPLIWASTWDRTPWPIEMRRMTAVMPITTPRMDRADLSGFIRSE